MIFHEMIIKDMFIFKNFRQTDMHRIPQLFMDNAWSKLCEIIINNIETSADLYEDENWLKDICLQIKLLLQSFWQTSLYAVN